MFLYSKLASLPDEMKEQVSDFIDFLLSKANADKRSHEIPKAQFGSGKGMFKMRPGFDEPLEDFKDYM